MGAAASALSVPEEYHSEPLILFTTLNSVVSLFI